MATLVLLPGLGADHRLFQHQREAFGADEADQVVVQPWIDPVDGEDLPAYARRLADVVAARVDRSRPLLLGGSSFGGMVALECARVLRPDGVVLIGSCRDLGGIRAVFRWLLPLVRLVPLIGHRWFARMGAAVAFVFGARSDVDRALFAEMLRASPPARVQWACNAMTRWRPRAIEGIPVFAVHGASDHLLPAALAQQADPQVVVVDGAGHLLPLTHAAATNAFLRGVLERFP
ncbi:MAG: alpha/beta hydrolase [Deltaproteobacteria bacterium]|nr:alpha/beta hydrolase [Deltaproteobacteria bacterium]